MLRAAAGAALIIGGLFNLQEVAGDLTKQSARLCLFTAHLRVCVALQHHISTMYTHTHFHLSTDFPILINPFLILLNGADLLSFTWSCVLLNLDLHQPT